VAIEDDRIAAVVIGRNEGELLQPSLRSVAVACSRAVYVDSGSSDGSPHLARSLGFPVVELSSDRPFSAARGRNEGVDEALRRWPNVEYILFLDGDCVLERDFLPAAAGVLDGDPKCAVVTGHLVERHPEASIYNKLCGIEWQSTPGPIKNASLGGIMVVRVSAFRQLGGFNEQAIAGEEPDLAARLLLAGYSMMKIDQPMATHDAQIMRFGQWWTRATRAGHAVAHRYARHGRTELRDGRRELMSAIFWGFGLPALTIVLIWPTRGCSLLLLGGYVLLGWRMHRHYSRTGLASSDAWLVTRFILYGKFAEFIGILRYLWNRLRGQFHIIEYR